MPFRHICFIFPLYQNKLFLLLGPVICNSLYLLHWKTGQNPDPWLSQDLERRWIGYHWLCALDWPAAPSKACFPFVIPTPLLFFFFSGLDHDSFMKTQREMGLLRVLLGKSYFVFTTTFLSSAAEGPFCQSRSYYTFGAPLPCSGSCWAHFQGWRMEEEERKGERFKKSVEVRTLKVENQGEKKSIKNWCKSKMRIQQRTCTCEEQGAERLIWCL